MSEDAPSVLTEIEEAASAAVPFTGTITAVAGAVSGGARVLDDIAQFIAPEVKSAQLDQPINAYKARLQTYEKISDNPNEAVRAAQLGNFFSQLLLDAGISVGSVGHVTVAVPVEYLNGFVDAVGQLIEERDEQRIAAETKTQPNPVK